MSLAYYVTKRRSLYMKPYVCNILFVLGHTCTFNTEILALLEVFKNMLFYHILK